MSNLSTTICKPSKLVVAAFLSLAVLSAAGCSSIGKAMNPFESEFSCSGGKGEDAGTCSSMQEAYAAAIKDGEKDPPAEQPATNGSEGMKTISVVEARDSYRTATYQKLTKLIKAPVTPMVAPPTVLRILILPYQDEDNGLNLMRYSFIMADKPRWILGNYLEEGH